MTGNPTTNNRFLWDGRGGDDLDIWVTLARRWYGRFTVPAREVAANRSRESLKLIESVRKRGSMVWSYTYTGVPGTPGFRATEPLSNPRMFLLWNALEGTHGMLYGQGTTNYKAAVNPFESVDRGGEFVLFYPGRLAPIPSARLEQIRDGLEDAAIFGLVRRKRGAAAVRRILGGTGLFSADARSVKLALQPRLRARGAACLRVAGVVARRDDAAEDRAGEGPGAETRRAGKPSGQLDAGSIRPAAAT